MNSLILTLDAGAGCCLPIAYQQLTQGALYAAWRGSYPQLHDEGFAGDGQTFRLFTFGPLEGRYRVQGNEITFTGLVQLEVRSPVEDLLYALGKSLTGAGALRLGRCVLPLRDPAQRGSLLVCRAAAGADGQPVDAAQIPARWQDAFSPPRR